MQRASNSTKLNDFRLANWNADGISLKWDKTKDFIQEHVAGIMAICETKLSDKMNLRMRDYTVHREDRNRRAGGVILLCKEDTKHHQINTNTTKIEAIGIRLHNRPTIISAYFSPRPRTRLDINDLDTMFSTSNTIAKSMPDNQEQSLSETVETTIKNIIDIQ